MARSDHQGTLIFAICALVFALIAVGACVYLNNLYTEAKSTVASAREENNKLKEENGKLRADGTQLRQWIGFQDGATEIAAVEKAFTDDVARYIPNNAAGEPIVGASYRTALQQLFSSYKSQGQDLDQKTKANLDMSNLLQSQQSKEAAMVASFKGEIDALNQESQNTRANFNQIETTLKSEKEALAAENVKMKNDATAAINIAKLAQAMAEKIRDEVIAINTILTEKIAALASPTVTYEDARVTYVSPDSKRVWVNIGSADGVTAHVTFQVFDPVSTDIAVDSSKGTIEITRVLGPNLSEARVNSDILINPILKDDIIYTPVWKPGQLTHFALSNDLDINGDGIDDTQELIKIIRMNGGEVDAYVDQFGDYIEVNGKRHRETKVIGTISDQTRYYVKGANVTGASSKQLMDARKQLDDDSERYSLQEITLQDLLRRMAYHNFARVEGFGEDRTIRNVNLLPDLPFTSSTGRVNEKFHNPNALPPSTNTGTVSPLFQKTKMVPTSGGGVATDLFRPRTPKLNNDEMPN